jgi:hypothetical protein
MEKSAIAENIPELLDLKIPMLSAGGVIRATAGECSLQKSMSMSYCDRCSYYLFLSLIFYKHLICDPSNNR